MKIPNVINNYKFSCIILAAVELDIFTLLQQPKSLDDFPKSFHKDPLARLLVALSEFGLISNAKETYSLTPAGRELISGTRSHALSEITLEQYLPAWSNLSYSVKTGQPAIEKTLGEGVWRKRAEGGTEGIKFMSFMSGIQQYMAPSIINSFDFSHYKNIADIGAGSGYLIKAILEKWKTLNGILFDLPHVIPTAKNTLKNLSNRCTFNSGSFFESSTLPQADLYILQYILHDWDDDKCLQILSNIKRIAPIGAKLLVIENHTKDTLKDLHMMIISGGKERTTREIHTLLNKSGCKGVRKLNSIISEADF